MMFHNLPVPGIPRRRRGFTIVEVVMAVIIIGVLTLALVPTLVNHAQNARINVCKQELENLANAEERVAIDTGYMVRPYALNDVGRGDGVPNAPLALPSTPAGSGFPISRIEGVRDNVVSANNLYGDAAGGGTGNNKPYFLFISPTTQDYLPTGQQDNIFSRLTGLPVSQLAGGSYTVDLNEGQPYPEQRFNWNGPYVSWKRDDDQDDWPNDPWGNPYYFFTKAGMIYPPQRNSNGSSGGQGNPTVDHSYPFQMSNSSGTGGTGGTGASLSEPYFAVNGTYYQWKAYDESGTSGGGMTYRPLFDRPTWVSIGPNCLPGDGSTDPMAPNAATNYGYGKGDDLFYSFGGGN